jgi:two-component system invasion response regulator UvrY
MISVALVDDHQLLRNGLCELIRSKPEFEVLFEADNGLELQQKLQADQIPDLILMDINMPHMDGYAATKWIKKYYPQIHIMALSVYADETSIIKMLRSGAEGYLLKDIAAAEFFEAMQEVVDNGFYYTQKVAGQVNRIIHEGRVPLEIEKISDREIDLLRMMATELTYKEIADQMYLSPKTIESYRERLCEKLQLRTRTGLVMYAIRKGIVQV